MVSSLLGEAQVTCAEEARVHRFKVQAVVQRGGSKKKKFKRGSFLLVPKSLHSSFTNFLTSKKLECVREVFSFLGGSRRVAQAPFHRTNKRSGNVQQAVI